MIPAVGSTIRPDATVRAMAGLSGLRSLLAALFLGVAAVPAVALEDLQPLDAFIGSGGAQADVTQRCAGYFRAMLITSSDAPPALVQRAQQTIEWLLEQTVSLRLLQTDGDVAALADDIGQTVETYAQFYLDRFIANIADHGHEGDALIAADQQVCVLLASQRPTD